MRPHLEGAENLVRDEVLEPDFTVQAGCVGDARVRGEAEYGETGAEQGGAEQRGGT